MCKYKTAYFKVSLSYRVFTSHLYYFQKKSNIRDGAFPQIFTIENCVQSHGSSLKYALAKVALEEYFSAHLNFSTQYIIPPTLHNHLSYEGDTSRHHEATVPRD
jgi:hypothetical protein